MSNHFINHQFVKALWVKNKQPQIWEFLFKFGETSSGNYGLAFTQPFTIFGMEIESIVKTGNTNNEENKFHFNDGRQFSISTYISPKGHYMKRPRHISQKTCNEKLDSLSTLKLFISDLTLVKPKCV